MDALKSAKEWVRHKVKNGSNVFRILPPFGDSSNGYPYRKWQIIWGLLDPTSGRIRPYASSLMTDKRDPVVEFVDGLKDRLTRMDGDLRARGLDEKAVLKHPKYARLAKFARDISPKTTYVYNAADKAGVVGLLELKSTAHKDMKLVMNEYIRDYNQDPTSLNSLDDDSGIWVNVKRSGEGFTTEYKAEKVQNKVKDASGRVSFVDDRSPLADVIVENFDNLAYDLSSVYKLNTYDDLNEVLQANLDNFYKVCPEADLTVPVDLDSEDGVESVMVRTTGNASLDSPVKTEAKSTSKVDLKLDAEDDEFFRQADAILKR